MNKSVKELKTKKEILMATFRRHLKKKNDSIRSGAGSDDVYKPIWFAYDLMESFLGPVYTCSNNVNSEERALSEKNETAAIEDEEVVENNDLEQPLRTPKPVRRRPATDTAERQMSSAFGHLTNILSKRQREYPPPPPKEDDDCELLGSNQPSTAQTSQLLINSPQPFTSRNHVYFDQSGSSNSTPTIQIISNELISQRTGASNELISQITETNRVNEALIKAYEDFDCEN
ncbi:unnamed protein product [Euphydryas editha]|uniref:MADF domain-containing protein n=1 Tax=Euphydryas editha TaxID=104508 RepID=A0AAU9TS11_EUPED|nr:unnamed protein product [Euphydryas editha]